MSSSSTTACSRSSSPSPATPESTDVSEQIFSPEDLSAWCNSLVSSGYANGDEQRPVDVSHAGVGQMLKLEDLLQDGLYQEYASIAAFAFASSPSTMQDKASRSRPGALTRSPHNRTVCTPSRLPNFHSLKCTSGRGACETCTTTTFTATSGPRLDGATCSLSTKGGMPEVSLPPLSRNACLITLQVCL